MLQLMFVIFRWNCSSRDEVTETRHGKFQDILGKTLRSGVVLCVKQLAQCIIHFIKILHCFSNF